MTILGSHLRGFLPQNGLIYCLDWVDASTLTLTDTGSTVSSGGGGDIRIDDATDMVGGIVMVPDTLDATTRYASWENPGLTATNPFPTASNNNTAGQGRTVGYISTTELTSAQNMSALLILDYLSFPGSTSTTQLRNFGSGPTEGFETVNHWGIVSSYDTKVDTASANFYINNMLQANFFSETASTFNHDRTFALFFTKNQAGNEIKTYVNGTLIATVANTNIITLTDNIFLFSSADASNNAIAQNQQLACIWNRVLTDTEIAAMHAGLDAVLDFGVDG